ncbi:hypothetical protein IWW50_001365 [Coemansia erecta]|nr:hypothetical protein IWW50_001365 [Coemansia erecta]
MDKKLRLELNAKRTVIGILRGYDAFMNINLAEAHELVGEDQTEQLGHAVIRGNSIVAIEALEPINV